MEIKEPKRGRGKRKRKRGIWWETVFNLFEICICMKMPLGNTVQCTINEKSQIKINTAKMIT